MLDANALFDSNFYLSRNSDVAAAIANNSFASALDHFLAFGQAENRNPSALFDATFYLNENLDVAAAVAAGTVASGFAHFLAFGQLEGRDPGPVFDTDFYLSQNLDVAAVVARDEITGIEHFVVFGESEGRNASPLFTEGFYLSQNPDVAAAIARDEITGIQHYIQFGQYEDRDPSALFDNSFYLEQNLDVAAAVENGTFDTAIEHFVAFGASEGRDPSRFFNTRFYLEQNPDVAAAVEQGIFDSAIDHFVTFGRAEGRFILPALELPDPTGNFNVGTVAFPLLDASRDEIFTPDPSDRRELVVQVWYPTEATTGTIAPYLDPITSQLVAGASGLPANLFNLVRPNAFAGAAIADDQPTYPVVFFSHGLGQLPNFYTAQQEALASHGYIVVGINHTYTSAVTVLPDGRILPFASSFLPTNLAEFEPAFNQAVGVRAADAQFVLNQLTALNTNDPSGLFTGRLDLAQVGMFGHSFGGATTTRVLQLDNRFRAGLSLEGILLSPSLTQPAIQQPLMLINAERTYDDSLIGQTLRPADLFLRQTLYQQAGGAAYNLTVGGTEHSNFSDRSLLFPLASIYSPDRLGRAGAFSFGLTDVGPIDGDRAIALTNEYTVAFFEEHLRGMPVPLLDGPSTLFPEVLFQSRNTLGIQQG